MNASHIYVDHASSLNNGEFTVYGSENLTSVVDIGVGNMALCGRGG